MADTEFKLLITGDASGAVSATEQAGAAIRKLKVDTSDLSDETRRSLGLMPVHQDNSNRRGQTAEAAGPWQLESARILTEVGDRAAPGAGGGRGEVSGGAEGVVLALVSVLETFQQRIDTVVVAADKLAGELARPDANRGQGVQGGRESAARADGMAFGKRLAEFACGSPSQTDRDLHEGGDEATSEAEAELGATRQPLEDKSKEKDQLSSGLPQSGAAKPAAADAAVVGQDMADEDPARLNPLSGELTQATAAGGCQEQVQRVIGALNTQGAKTNEALDRMADAIGVCEQQKLATVERMLVGQMAMQQAWSGVEQRLKMVEAQLAAMPQHQY